MAHGQQEWTLKIIQILPTRSETCHGEHSWACGQMNKVHGAVGISGHVIFRSAQLDCWTWEVPCPRLALLYQRRALSSLDAKLWVRSQRHWCEFSEYSLQNLPKGGRHGSCYGKLYGGSWKIIKNKEFQEFPGSPVTKMPHLHCKGGWGWLLIGELRSHKTHSKGKKKKN